MTSRDSNIYAGKPKEMIDQAQGLKKFLQAEWFDGNKCELAGGSGPQSDTRR